MQWSHVRKVLFFILVVLSLFITPAIALFIGLSFALLLGGEKQKISSHLLKISVVCLALNMNIIESLRSSWEGMVLTIFSVFIVMILGVLFGRWLRLSTNTAYLISSGTAICGGSAIAAIAPVIKARDEDISISLAVVFTLNAIGMLTFPYLGHYLGLSQQDFGMWAAIAIHDTSAVVGAGKAYGDEALLIATTVKLSRVLWIIPLSLLSFYLVRKEADRKASDSKEAGAEKKSSSGISIPWFIIFVIAAMCLNTYMPLHEGLAYVVKKVAYALLSLSLFLIGATLSIKVLKSMGLRPLLLGIILWIVIMVSSLLFIIAD